MKYTGKNITFEHCWPVDDAPPWDCLELANAHLTLSIQKHKCRLRFPSDKRGGMLLKEWWRSEFIYATRWALSFPHPEAADIREILNAVGTWDLHLHAQDSGERPFLIRSWVRAGVVWPGDGRLPLVTMVPLGQGDREADKQFGLQP